MKLVLVGLYCGPLLTLISPLTAKNCGSGNRVSGFHVSGGPPVLGVHSPCVVRMFLITLYYSLKILYPCRDGRLTVGDEIVNVNGRRLRGLSMPEAKNILQNCILQSAMDIVIARGSSGPGGASGLAKNLVKSLSEIIDQPLSLLAHHDEQDLINLSSTPLRPDLADGPPNNGN